MSEKKVKVPNISCHHCVRTIKNELSDLAGVKAVEGDPKAKTITVKFEAPATWDKIVETMKEINYPPAE